MANANDIKLEVKVKSHSWDELYESFPAPVPQADANVFPGLGPVAETMHTAIFGPTGLKMERDYREAMWRQERHSPEEFEQGYHDAFARAFQNPVEMQEMEKEYAAAIGRDTIMSFGVGLSGEPFITPLEANKRAMRLAKAARRTHMIATFKSRIKRTWHLFSTIPQTISAIWTTPPMTAEQALMKAVSSVYSYPTGYPTDVDFSRMRERGQDFAQRQARSERMQEIFSQQVEQFGLQEEQGLESFYIPGPSSQHPFAIRPHAAFCTPSRNPLTGEFSFGE